MNGENGQNESELLRPLQRADTYNNCFSPGNKNYF